ncbi:putative MFS transporter [Seiridium cardinale]
MADRQTPSRRVNNQSAATEVEPLLVNDIDQPRLISNATPAPDLNNSDSSRQTQSKDRKNVAVTRELALRIATAMFAFMVMGMIQSTVGVMIPHFEEYYGLSDTLVSLIFLLTPLGYFVAAYLNTFIHLQLGQRGIATIGPACQLIYAVGLCMHPPYPLLLILSMVGAIGTGLLDGSWCAWAGAMENANTVQGFLHGSYSIGASLGPFIAGTMISVGKTPWYHWFYVLSAFCIVMLASSAYAFRLQDAKTYRVEKHDREEHDSLPDKQGSLAIFKHSATWICAAYFLAYVGIEGSITGWIVVYMLRARHASGYLASICSSLFNIGMAAGRLALGIVTDKLGVRLAVIIYLSTAAALQVLFALVEIPAISAVIITAIGFLLGPMFPSGVVMIARLLPANLHVGAVSFVASVGEVGGSLLPFALGVIADRLGIGAFQYIILVQLMVTILIWLCFPKLAPKAQRVETADEHNMANGNMEG